MSEKPVIIIEEDSAEVKEQREGEIPVITIENDDTTQTPRMRTSWWLGISIVSVLLCIIAIGCYKYYYTYINIGIPVSVSSEQNIEKLQQTAIPQTSGVIMTSDSILGVALNFYELKGLKAEISLEEPDTTDMDVYLYSRCADHTSYDPNINHYIGSLVVNGKELESDNTRLGYCAMANNNIVIGVARDEDVKDYVQEQGGSFFRQFILVSDGVLPAQFYLHGKVERRGLGRIGKKLYYIETRHKETMWDFADALREYGFIDAIYITGGTDYSFYRTEDGTAHGIGDSTKYEEKHKGKGIIPWMVFRQAK